MGQFAENEPSHGTTHGVTQLLDAVRHNEPGARDQLLELVYGELHRLARRQLVYEAGNRTLQPTALVNEAYLRLFGNTGGSYENRRHFFAAAAQAMHRICADSARRRRSAKRGGGLAAAVLAEEPAVFDRDPVEVLAVDEALARLAREDPELVEIVRLRYFVDLSLDDTAKVLGISRRTVANRWRLARAWLCDALRDFKEPPGAK